MHGCTGAGLAAADKGSGKTGPAWSCDGLRWLRRPTTCNAYGQTPSHLDPSLYTHLIYAFAKVDGGNFSVVNVEFDDDQLIKQLTALKATNKALKLMISIGGWSFSRASETFTGEAAEFRFHRVPGP